MTERHVDAIADQYVEDFARLDPVAATFIGVDGHDDRLTDLSPAGFAAREELARKALADATAATPVDEREAVAREAFLERVGLEVEMAEAGLVRSQLTVIASELHAVRQVFDLMPTEGEQAWRNIDARLAAVPEALAGLRTTLAEEAERGNVSAVRQYQAVVGQIESWTGRSGDGGPVFAGLVAGCEVDGMRPALEQHASAATEALDGFGRFVQEELVPRGRHQDACGREQYELASRYFLGAAVDLDETYAWGWQELKRLSDDMAATADRVLPGASYAEAVAHLEGDASRRIEGREAFRDWMQELADRTVAELADVHFDIPGPVRRIECMLAPTNDGGIYYTGPSEDFSRPGRMWWSVPDGIDSFSPWREVTTVFHEGVPGHHLQIGQTAYRSEVLNRWQRLMCWCSGHGEGWALYAERLMDELGHLDDPADRLGMLDAQSFRAARVIVDIGMHLELEIPEDNPFGFHPGETWTPDLGFEFMREHCAMEEAFIRFEVNRYLGWPGQAPSYKVGERIWLDARAQAQARAGDGFDLKTFHRQALDLGCLGLDPLQKALARL
ncbi:DUF885 domain-containing protein [Nocardioides euryhalodurans]|uniref:DUF885 domain-containing protein n=1 Tax=Nocardioides euryhalodurans TaxID=2518370 RepID=A0A4P7GJ63_9ACTN|nr:DUF885 domain-containing protein [Nocardioides euryhalodurans]QBR92016.1 DUF885 domain-containing protein [Nocardioides euryhalodurans]